jgi:hypothetical protein
MLDAVVLARVCEHGVLRKIVFRARGLREQR